MPRTITLNLSQAQYADLMTLLSRGKDQLDLLIEDEIDEEVLEEHRYLKRQGVPALLHIMGRAAQDPA